jgi:hypothetical protein
MVREEAGVKQGGGEGPEAVRSELLALIERLEQLVLSGVATLDDYGALAAAQQEWERGL